MNGNRLAVLFAALAILPAPAIAQSAASRQGPHEFYRLTFVVKEMDNGKTVKSHSYQMEVSSFAGKFSIRSGAKVPVTDPKGTTYIDVGTNVDVLNLTKSQNGLEVDLLAEVSNIVSAGSSTQLTRQPIINQTRWESRVEIPIGKAATIFSSDDPSSKNQLQLEVSAEQIQ